MPRIKDEIGNRYGRLTVIEKAGQNEKKSLLWKCRCDCGNISVCVGDLLRRGTVRSCGCLRRIDEKIGAKYGKLTVVKKAGTNKWGQVQWECRCKCGNITKVVGSSLRNGHIKSCGCLHGLPEGEAAFNAIVNSIKFSAKKRGYSYELTNKQLREITKKNCHYCNSPPSNAQKTYYANGNYTYSGVDRVNNKKGYTIDNVVPCCRICNRAKDTMSTTEFLKWIERVSTHQRRLSK